MVTKCNPNDIGANIVPVVSQHKTAKERFTWKKWQTKSIPPDLFEEWKENGGFNDGVGIILGKLWRGKNADLYLIGVDLDNLIAIEEFCNIGGKNISLSELAQWTIVEQHKDDSNKAHVYFLSNRAYTKKSSDIGNKKLFNPQTMPAIEIKGDAEHGLFFCSPSLHKRGHRYEIIGTKDPALIEEDYELHIDNLCTKYGIKYLDHGIFESKVMHLLDPKHSNSAGERHNNTLAVMNHYIYKNAYKLPEYQQTNQQLEDFIVKYNKEQNDRPLPDEEISTMWRDVLKRSSTRLQSEEHAIRAHHRKLRQEQQQLQGHQEPYQQHIAVKQKNGEKRTIDLKQDYTEQLMEKYQFVTLDDTMEIRYYYNGAYLSKGEQLIKKELEQIGGFSVNINLRREIIEHIKNRTLKSRSEFDKDLNVINVKNGLYHITENKITPHTPDYLSLVQKPITYDPEAKSELFEKFLSEVVYRQDIRTLKEAMAYTFHSANPYEYYFIRIGKGGNGKGVCDQMLIALHGMENVSNIKLQQLQDNRFTKYHLIGKDVNIDPELSSGRIKDLAVLKELTGQIPIFVEAKGKDGYEVVLHVKNLFSANELPPIEDDTDAHYRREVLISFPYKFELLAKEQGMDQDEADYDNGDEDDKVQVKRADPYLAKKLTTEKELSGIFNILMDSLRSLLTNNGIHLVAKTVEQRRTKSKMAADTINAFLEQAIAEDSIYNQDAMSKTSLYAAYRQFCEDNGVVPESTKKFGSVMKTRYKSGRESTGKRRMFWWGIKLGDNNNNKYKDKFADIPPLNLAQTETIEQQQQRQAKGPTYTVSR
jgi:putative DNA primase/helicase